MDLVNRGVISSASNTGGHSHTLSDVADAFVDNPREGDVLTYSDNKWIASYSPPTGSIMMWPTNSEPTGWLFCEGQEVAIDKYEDLYKILLTTYGIITNGAGTGTAGTTHFQLPDLRSRVPIGAGQGYGTVYNANATTTTQGNLTTRTLGTSYGMEGTKLIASMHLAHDHGSSGAHQHIAVYYETSGGANDYNNDDGVNFGVDTQTGVQGPMNITTSAGGGSHTHTAFGTALAAGQVAVPIIPPALALNFIIKI
ncbi:Phage tail collar domain containing protein [uncultured Caudovirales phage]|uniref:Phage tail collar domain containing protein n=1 Tax=uncultured Caudovirales phage TaxID=2100421 RepID=A0A6J5RLU3_9CAUD|nr:Phage tail collar domain containing protein [uncultured Caudovirales phage]